MTTMFHDRSDAGRRLAVRLGGYAGQAGLLVLGLPRGGVPVAFEVARALRAPLDVFAGRKIGAPWHAELAMGAVASGGVLVANEELIRNSRISPEIFNAAAERELRELERCEHAYRGDRAPVAAAGRPVILVDDGIATGSTVRAAVAALRKLAPERIIVGAPIIAADTFKELQPEVDALEAVITPEFFSSVGQWYEDFSQTGDEEVRALLERANGPEAQSAPE